MSICIFITPYNCFIFVTRSLLFVSISSTGEPAAVLLKQLEFLYAQILLVLTDRVHAVLKNNSSKDLRDLLGSETSRLMLTSCNADMASPAVAFQSVQGMPMPHDLRCEISSYLNDCVNSSGAA